MRKNRVTAEDAEVRKRREIKQDTAAELLTQASLVRDSAAVNPFPRPFRVFRGYCLFIHMSELCQI